MAHEVYNGKLHLVIQKDEEPGVHVQPEDIADPVGDNIQIYLAISTDLVPSFNEGVDGFEANAVSAYPNPTSNNFTLVTESFVGGQMTVYDAMGRIVMKDNIATGKTNVSVVNWNKGVYHLVVNKGNSSFQTSLVVE
jgi:regulation of enolase protein 1 (concanavalin A-like superfamily)